MYHKLPGKARTDDATATALGFLLLIGGGYILPRLAAMTIAQRVALGILLVSLIAALTVLIRDLYRRRERERLMHHAAYELKPTDFEKRIELLLRDLGWKHVEHVGQTNDRGVDLRGSYQGRTYVIQCKRYKNLVQPEKVRELLGVRENEGAQGAILVTTGRFGPGSSDFARKHQIELWDGEVLGQKLREAEDRRQTLAVRGQATRRRMYLFSVLALLNGCAMLWATFGGR